LRIKKFIPKMNSKQKTIKSGTFITKNGGKASNAPEKNAEYFNRLSDKPKQPLKRDRNATYIYHICYGHDLDKKNATLLHRIPPPGGL